MDDVLSSHLTAAGGRFRGLRQGAAYDPDDSIPRNASAPPPRLYAMPEFREGFGRLRHFGLSFDAWLFHPQIPELTALADAYPYQPIVLDHMGTPLGLGAYAGRRSEVFTHWRAAIQDLAHRPNVTVKLGGLGMAICGFGFESRSTPVSSSELAEAWRPYIESCITAFGCEQLPFVVEYLQANHGWLLQG